jgi:uncharacterized protein YecE (DUF72 family)
MDHLHTESVLPCRSLRAVLVFQFSPSFRPWLGLMANWRASSTFTISRLSPRAKAEFEERTNQVKWQGTTEQAWAEAQVLLSKVESMSCS